VPWQRAVIAVIREQAVGYGASKPLPGGEVDTQRRFVRPEARGGQIAERVLNELLA